MHYRILGKTKLKTSILGFGCMRLPIIKWDEENINQKKAIEIIRKGIDAGINYIDTAEPYHNGESEVVVGKALKDAYREKVILVTKSPVWRDEFTKPEHFEKYLEIQLKRLDIDYIDIYLLHALGAKNWKEKVLGLNLIERAKKAKAQGKIKHLGFSFHDKPEILKEIIDSNEFEVMLVQYNILDTSNEEMIKYAANKGIGVVIMGPVGGGRLAGEPVKEMKKLLSEGQENFADLALKFVWSNPYISTAISGMGTMEMVEDNLSLAKNKSHTFTNEEKNKTKIIEKRFKELTNNICTSCGYCMPCPNGVNIAFIFKALMYYQVYGQKETGKLCYAKIGCVDGLWPPGKRVDACTECGECEKKCPQKISIIEQLKQAHEVLSS